MTHDEMTYLCIYPYGILLPTHSLKASINMRGDMSKAAPPSFHARAREEALSSILFQNKLTRKPMSVRENPSSREI